MRDDFIEKRSESRSIVDKYHSVEISTSNTAYIYQFKIWDISKKGVCILVKEDSDLLNHLQVGDILDLKYYPTDSSHPIEHLKTQIKHITKDDQGRFKGHYLVGLLVVDKR